MSKEFDLNSFVIEDVLRAVEKTKKKKEKRKKNKKDKSEIISQYVDTRRNDQALKNAITDYRTVESMLVNNYWINEAITVKIGGYDK